jgi:chemotaxis protein MotB
MRSLRSALVASVVFAGIVACDNKENEARIAELEGQLEQAHKSASEREAAEKAELDKQAAELAQANATLAELEAERDAQQAKVTQLESTKGALEGQLEQKQAALDAVKALQDSLAKSLVEEIETGDIRVSQRDGLLVVDVSDTVLFAIGEAELSERGQKVLTRLAESLLALPDQAIFQVGGHTDNSPIKSEEVKAKFPTNWELSAARATNVVRFLEETAGIPGKRLIAAGFSEFRPVASNKNPKGRAKNRRIEIALLPAAKD